MAKKEHTHRQQAREGFYQYYEEIAKHAKDDNEWREFLIDSVVSESLIFLYGWLPRHTGLSTQEIQQRIDLFWEQSRQTRLQSELHTMPYAEYLLTEHWQKTRLEALERASHRCQVCNSPTALNTHHRTYERRGHELPEDLIVLCQSCHQLFHDNGKLQVEE